MPKIIPLSFVFCLASILSYSQLTSELLQQYIQHIQGADKEKITNFYIHLNYQPAWLPQKNSDNLDTVINILQKAPELGLDPKEYNLGYIQSIRNGKPGLQTNADSLNAEINITTFVIHFYSDLALGNTTPDFGYKGLNQPAQCADIPILLATYVQNKKIASLVQLLSSGLPEIIILENKIKWLTNIMANSNFMEVTSLPNKLNGANSSLFLKLYQLGIMDSFTTQLPDSVFKKKIKEAQQQFGLLSDGVIRSTFIQELNIPLAARLRQLNQALNYYRWLNCFVQHQTLVLVNIPAAYMKVYRNGKVILEMKLVVGKPSTPTPTLTSTITEVILYPYWHVPYSIATKELLPIIKKSPNYVNTAGYQLLDSKGKIVDPLSVNWQSLSVTYFPYTIRQTTGCDNALGLLKLNFYNPYSVYLHDTPMKNAFSLNKRYYSHDCMRMEKPMELGHIILSHNNLAIDTLEQKGCLRNQAPITVQADQETPIIVWYNTIGIDPKGRLVFYEDVYKKFR